MKNNFFSTLFVVMSMSALAEEGVNSSASIKPAGAPVARNSVARAQFTTSVVDREPVNRVTRLTNDVRLVYYFTELHGLDGQTATHRWELNGKVMSEMKLVIGSSRWRVFTSKKLDPTWLGEWKVSVLDSNGGTLGASTFTYAPASKASGRAKPAR